MKKEDFDSLMLSINQGIEHMRGIDNGCVLHHVKVPDEVDVKSIRKNLNMTQAAFSQTFGFPLSTLKNWESHTRTPEKSARILLTLIARNPEMVLKYAG